MSLPFLPLFSPMECVHICFFPLLDNDHKKGFHVCTHLLCSGYLREAIQIFETFVQGIYGFTNSPSGYLTHKTGHGAVLTTFSAVLPKSA